MGDLLGSLVWGSQKQTILCAIGVGCYKGETHKDLDMKVDGCWMVVILKS
jgi:hypothetical protein